MKSKKKVLCLALPGINDNCGNWRFIQPFRNFKSNILDISICFGDWFPRHDYYDVIVLQRPVKGWIDFIHLMKSKGKRIFLDIDDLFPLDDIDNPTYKIYKEGSEYSNHILECCKICDGIITNTDYLKEHYLKYNNNVTVIHNAINLNDDKYNKPRQRVSEKVTMLWSGSSGHKSNLLKIKEAIELCLNEDKNLVFAICGNKELLDIFENINLEQKIHIPECDFENFKNVHSIADFTLAPLNNTKYNLSKSNIRILESSVWKIPTIASDIGEYKIAEKICNDTEEWINAIKEYSLNIKKRKQDGLNAYKELDFYNLYIENKKRENFLNS